MRQTLDKQIGDDVYIVNQLGALEGRKVLARLFQMFGGVVAGMAGPGKTDLVGGFVSLANPITEDQPEFFCNTFAKFTQVRTPDGKTRVLKDIFDDHFVGKYREMIEWLAFCLEVNFANFLAGVGGFGDLFGSKKEPSQSESPKA